MNPKTEKYTHHIKKKLTVQNIEEAAEALRKILTGSRTVELDLSDVCEIDTSGLQLLMSCQKEAHNQGNQIHFVRPSNAVRSILELYELTEHFRISATPPELDEAHAKP